MATENTDLVRKIKNPRRILYVILALIALISLPIVKMALSESQSKRDKQRSMHDHAEPDAGVIVIKTTYSGVPIHLDPDQRMIAAPVMGNIGWEQAVNGVPTRRYPVRGEPIDLVDPTTIGVARTGAYRILENQAIDRAEIAYCKYRGPNPPSGWFDMALNNRRQ